MSWILGFVGALMGALFAEESRIGFGFLAGAALGVLFGLLFTLRRRVARLEQQVTTLMGYSAAARSQASSPPSPAGAAGPAVG
ncbi:MAG TPA: hypothetical protein VFY00_03805, partial [Arenimonas sp.]|nr:hypothetical protein [Arenimonas sp.]